MKNRNWLASAGLLYVVVWIVGLLIGSGTLDTSASSADLTSYFLTHQSIYLMQPYLIDGVAGVAAASVSLVQAGLQEVLVNPDVLAAGDGSIRTILVLLNTTDTFKLLALALFSGAVSALILRADALSRWLGWLGVALSLALIVGGLSFLLDSSALLSILFASLPLLLPWGGALSVVILRRTEHSAYAMQA